ncbi:DNA polymerase I [Maritalea mediterranea]|uniref:DNA polymerase I n=1 Tax=Maritalea mediterranea TaxID=2909667 RepID=A0ABS9E2V3_9HYPH|nr:DNA polymerase I [Maritalea mediterranea]MCF4097181.1 DNA polymerase I [Maritalea mediterranea]
MHLLLVDGSTYIFRAYHALPPLARKSDGLPVGAVSGFCNMLYKLTLDFEGEENPTHMAVIFDHSGKSFRNDFYPDYKAHRPPAPEDLVPQFPLTREATRAFGIASVEQEGFEADDLIATYARQAEAKGMRVTIVSSDKDLMQLVSDNISMLDTMKNKWISYDEVQEKFGCGPDKVVDIQSLAGDSVDNVPGVPGIGVKTAAQLIAEYGDLDTLLERASEIKQNKRREKLIEFADQARISRDLVRLKEDVPVEVPLDDLSRQPIVAGDVIPFLKAMEFTTITKRVAAALEADAEEIDADERLAADVSEEVAAAPQATGGHTPQSRFDQVLAEVQAIPVDHSKYEIVRTPDALQKWVDAIWDKGHVAIDTETTGLDNQQAELVGICLATEMGEACYIPLQHTTGEDDLLGGGMAPDQLPLKDVLEALKPVLEARSILKIGQNMKYDMGMLMRYGIEMAPIDDTMLMSYVTDGARNNGMDALAEKWLNHTPIKFTDLAGTGKKQKTFDQLEIESAAQYAAEDADVTLRLWHVLKQRVVAEKGTTLYETIERPLVPVLARMEARGIHVDRQVLSKLSGEFAQRAAALEAEAHELADEKFNVGSPKQLGDILFGKMELPGGKKTKTGAWQTGASVLEDLAAEGNALAQKVLEWRGLSKLKSTYTDALPEYINQRTGRVHTSYAQAAVATGRLSSSEPNLQNIPVRSEDGRKIRCAFVAEKGKKLISADYSQIELRVLAHIADIDALKNAFAEGLDIHAMTASEMFNVPIEGMDPMVRRQAKAINFGIIYGISAFGLANQLGISRSEASDYIKKYFERFPGIQDYMNEMKKFAHDKGYVETLFGRKAFFPEINTKNQGHRAFYERAAINAPIQGTAADIIRRAMIKMESVLQESSVPADMLLQVHDELIFEVPEDRADDAIPLIQRVMSEAALPAVHLSVPLDVDARAADNWNDAH